VTSLILLLVRYYIGLLSPDTRPFAFAAFCFRRIEYRVSIVRFPGQCRDLSPKFLKALRQYFRLLPACLPIDAFTCLQQLWCHRVRHTTGSGDLFCSCQRLIGVITRELNSFGIYYVRGQDNSEAENNEPGSLAPSNGENTCQMANTRITALKLPTPAA
jgi:hypothetical protein